jgi:hypothetical protein
MKRRKVDFVERVRKKYSNPKYGISEKEKKDYENDCAEYCKMHLEDMLSTKGFKGSTYKIIRLFIKIQKELAAAQSKAKTIHPAGIRI